MIKKTWIRMMTAFSSLFDEQARPAAAYLKEENRALREHLRHKCGRRQVRLSDSQRHRLATKRMAVGRRPLNDLTDVFAMVVRANKSQVTEDVYRRKTSRWKQCWPQLQIIPW